MRFSLAAIAFAAGAIASEAVTETMTDYTTYCPEATTISHGSHTYSISTPGHITFSHGPYTVTRPLVTQTVTQCNKCSSSTPVPTTPVSSPAPGAATSTPLIPSGADATGVPPAASSSQPAFNAGAVNAATGAGAGLAAVFGVAALLL